MPDRTPSASSSNPACVPSQREYRKRPTVDQFSSSAAGAVDGLAADGVLVEALGEVEPLEDELDRRSDLGWCLADPEGGQRRLDAGQRRRLGVGGRGHVLAGVDDETVLEGG